MPMHNPPHPGGIVRRQCIEPLGLSLAEAAEGLGVAPEALSDLLDEQVGVSTEMAIRLARAFGSSPEMWLGLQMAFDLWHAESRLEHIKVRQFHDAC